jgi:hypothetical protein
MFDASQTAIREDVVDIAARGGALAPIGPFETAALTFNFGVHAHLIFSIACGLLACRMLFTVV